MTNNPIQWSEETVELVAKELFNHEQSGRFPPVLVNQALYGQPTVTWEIINEERFVRSCSDVYRKQALAALSVIAECKELEVIKKGLISANMVINILCDMEYPDRDRAIDAGGKLGQAYKKLHTALKLFT